MISTTLTTHPARTPGSALAAIHEGWIRQVRSILDPATDLRADLWNRWGAVRFLVDQFQDRFRLECAFAEAIEGRITPDVAARLAAAREDVECTREKLIAAGRHRNMPEPTAVLARRLLKELARWCVELELAAEQLDPADLPLSAKRLLARLRVADTLGQRAPSRSAAPHINQLRLDTGQALAQRA